MQEAAPVQVRAGRRHGRRESAYDRKSSVGRLERGFDEAARREWLIVSMKNNWRDVY
jgi:hypothetical protein